MNTSKSVYCHVSRSGQGKLTMQFSYVTFWKFDLLYNSLSNTIEVSCERKDDYHIKVSLIGNNSQTYLTQSENALKKHGFAFERRTLWSSSKLQAWSPWPFQSPLKVCPKSVYIVCNTNQIDIHFVEGDESQERENQNKCWKFKIIRSFVPKNVILT